MQAIVQDEKLQEYLHLELAARKPLYIVFPKIGKEKISLVDDEIYIVKEVSDVENQNYLKIINFKSENDEVNFSIYYKLENIEFSGTLCKTAQKWVMVHSGIIEF